MGWSWRRGVDSDSPLESKERLQILADTEVEEVALPEQGILGEEDAWTISPSPTRIGLGSFHSTTTTLPPTPSASPASAATLDTSSLERLVASRLDLVEDTLRSVEVHLLEGLPEQLATLLGGMVEGEALEEEEIDEMSPLEEAIDSAGSMAVVEDVVEANEPLSLLDMYEAAALSVNPFLKMAAKGESTSAGTEEKIGLSEVSAMLLDNLGGLATLSFVKRAGDTGLLLEEEVSSLLALMELADPGDPEEALNDRLDHRELLTFAGLVAAWREDRLEGGEGGS